MHRGRARSERALEIERELAVPEELEPGAKRAWAGRVRNFRQRELMYGYTVCTARVRDGIGDITVN